MTFVLSVVARPPTGHLAPPAPEAQAPATGDGNRAVAAILESMRAALDRGGLPYQAHLVEVAYVRELAILLAQLREEGRVPDILQLVGHGSPGRLQLGSYWTGQAFDRRGGHGVLTSDPETLALLVDRLAPPTRVFLLGCHVGAERPSGYVASGKALLFSFEALTGAHCYAPDELITPQDFPDGFLYDGPLVMSCGKPANPASAVRRRSSGA